MIDNNGQASAELILLFGGIIVVVLLAIYMYKNYIKDLSNEINKGEVSKFNNELSKIAEYF